MSRQKIDYGIDLGTTNSSIARMVNGQIEIIRSDEFLKDTTPSCILIKPKAIIAGDKAFNILGEENIEAFRTRSDKKRNTFAEFKRNMGTTTQYLASNRNAAFSSEELSAEVLKKLRNYVKDEDVDCAVITVPAKFRQNQLDATQKAAELAGFKYCELLQEPIAASLAYGINAEKAKGYWLVFDFGGGTFDAALMKVDDGIIKVVDTEGDNHLGGKNLDIAIIDEIIIPELAKRYKLEKVLSGDERGLLKSALKRIAEGIKIDLSAANKKTSTIQTDDQSIGNDDDGNEIVIDEIPIALEQFERIAEPIMNRSIDISNELLKRNNLTGQDLITVILIGGPTYSQTFRKLLRDRLSSKIDTSVDPMTAVAKGAALFASTRDIPSNLQQRDGGKVQLILKYAETTVETEENVGIKVDRGNTTGNIPSQLFIELSRNDGAWSSGKVRLEGDAEIIEVTLMEGKPNGYSIKLYDEKGNALICEPSTFIIIQGIRVPDATLTYSIGIEAIDSSKGKACFHSIPGLERNKTLPAKGKIPLTTQKAIRPGNSSDFISIPILEAMHDAEGTPAILHERAKTIKISGDDIPQYLPEDSEVEIRISVDSSRRMSASFYFKYIDHTIDNRDIDIDKTEDIQKEELVEGILHANSQIDALDIDGLNHLIEHADKLKKELDYLDGILKKGGNEADTKNQVKEGIRRVLKATGKIEDEIEWPQTQKELDSALKDLKVNSARYGDERAEGIVEDFEKKKMEAIYHKNSKIAQQLKDQIEGFEFMLLSQDIGFWIGFIKHYDDEIDNLRWKDKDEAVRLIQQAKEAISKKPSKEQIESIVRQIWDMLVEKHIQITGKVRENLLKR